MADYKMKRMGRFSIRLETIEKNDGLVAKLMLSGVLVLAVDHQYDTNTIEYLGICDQFDEVPQGQIAPHYDAKFDEPRAYDVPDPDCEGVVYGQKIRVFERWVRRA